MNAKDLRELLEGVEDNVEVRLMTQPAYPMEWSIRSAVTRSELDAEADADAEAEGGPGVELDRPKQKEVLYLTEGAWIGYGRRAAF